jgi:hypothetical protein
MIYFHEVDKTSIDIVIPKPAGHVRKVGTSDRKPAKSTLVDLPTGLYSIEGPKSSRQNLRDLFDPHAYLVLKKSKVKFDRKAAEAICAIVRVPKPNLVRFFRSSEPTLVDIFGDPPHPNGVAYRKPEVVNDVVVLTYLDLKPATVLTLASEGRQMTSRKCGETRFINWYLHSNEERRLVRADDRHDTDLNSFLKIGKRNTHFVLSGVGPKEVHHDIRGTGLGASSLAGYAELPVEPGVPIDLKHCGQLGCTGGSGG